jgi:hypothetical protein
MLRAAEHAAKPDHSIWRSVNKTVVFDKTKVYYNVSSWVDFAMLDDSMLMALLDR